MGIVERQNRERIRRSRVGQPILLNKLGFIEKMRRMPSCSFLGIIPRVTSFEGWNNEVNVENKGNVFTTHFEFEFVMDDERGNV